jgi:hypothetical protein
MATHDITQALVGSLDESIRDQLFALVDGASVVESLTGTRPHRTALHRWAQRGIAGVRLRTVTAGRRRYTTRRWLLIWFADVDASTRGTGACP